VLLKSQRELAALPLAEAQLNVSGRAYAPGLLR